MNTGWAYYPLVNVNKKQLKMAIEIVSFPMTSMVFVHSYVHVYQRVKLLEPMGGPEMTVFWSQTRRTSALQVIQGPLNLMVFPCGRVHPVWGIIYPLVI